jgi:hypothetical protein
VIVIIDQESASVREADDFSRMSVQTSQDVTITDHVLIETGLTSSPSSSDTTTGPWHAWLRITRLRDLAAQSLGDRSEQWEESWSKMIRFASDNGWVSEDGAFVRAHVEVA